MTVLFTVTYLFLGFARLVAVLPDYDLPVVDHRLRVLDVCAHILLWPWPIMVNLFRKFRG